MPDDKDQKKLGRPPKVMPNFDNKAKNETPKAIKRPFEALVVKYKIAKPEAAALRRFLPCDESGMILEKQFTEGYATWLKSSPTKSGR